MKIEGDALNTQPAQHRPVHATDRREPSPVPSLSTVALCRRMRRKRQTRRRIRRRRIWRRRRLSFFISEWNKTEEPVVLGRESYKEQEAHPRDTQHIRQHMHAGTYAHQTNNTINGSMPAPPQCNSGIHRGKTLPRCSCVPIRVILPLEPPRRHSPA